MASFEFLAVILTGIGLSASITYYAMNLKNQNETQKQSLENRKAQLLMNIYNKYTETELLQQQLDILAGKWDGIDDFWDRYGPYKNPEYYTKFSRLAYYFDGIGVMLKRGMIDRDAIYDLMGYHVLQYWNHPYGPLMEGLRLKWDNPEAYRWFEYLAEEMKKQANP